MTRLLDNVSWLGDVASRFVGDWTGSRLPQIGLSTRFLYEAADELTRQAGEQRSASRSSGSSVGPVASTLPSGAWFPDSRRAEHFGSEGSPRADLIEAFWATEDGSRAGQDEIEIRRLDNGSFIVVLPGVVDLTNGIDEVAGGFLRGDVVGHWYDGDQPNTNRRMEYAIGEAQDTDDSYQNPYALRVIELMREGGVPPGSDVMLMGHSFGAYTAMELAGNEMFNSSDGSSAGFHVNVTHVLAAGGDTNWKFAEIPPETSALVLNNRYDAAFRAEDGLVGDLDPSYSNHLDIEFWGDKPWEKGWGAGHRPSGYVEFLTEANDRDDLNTWLDDAGERYGGGGTAYSLKVEDFQ